MSFSRPASATWLRSDVRRTAVGLDLDEPTLRWGLRENFNNLPGGAEGRLCLLLGDVLEPMERAREVRSTPLAARDDGTGAASTSCGMERESGSAEQQGDEQPAEESSGLEAGASPRQEAAEGAVEEPLEHVTEGRQPAMGNEVRHAIPDIICAFNFSACCLLTRSQLGAYLAGVHARLAGQGRGEGGGGSSESGLPGGRRRGGVFAMDLYGGTSSECALKLHRRYGDVDVRGCALTSVMRAPS